VLTIGQLARYVGVSTKTIRVYHEKGLLPEPGRDTSGYRRYTARDAIELIKIRTLAEAGVPLAKIGQLRVAPPADVHSALDRIDADLGDRIDRLRLTRERLRRLHSGRTAALPADVVAHLDGLPALGFSGGWVDLVTDLWILVFTTHPDEGMDLFRDQAQSLVDPDLRRIYLDYDRCRDLDPADPLVDELARRIVDATRRRYGPGELPGQDANSPIPALIQQSVNSMSPAWRRLDALIRAMLAHRPAAGVSE